MTAIHLIDTLQERATHDQERGQPEQPQVKARTDMTLSSWRA